MITAFAPGRLNLIGEHTDYNAGLALPFAITAGVRVTAQPTTDDRIIARALDLDQSDEFALHEPENAGGWRAFVRGAAAELQRAGFVLAGAELTIIGDVPRGSGLSSSAALEVAVCLALLATAGHAVTDRIALAQLCSRVENDWVGARTGLLDQLASLCAEPGHAVRIDFRALTLEQVPLDLAGHQIVTLDSGESHSLKDSGYNTRRFECGEASRLLGVESLREAGLAEVEDLPEPFNRRARHILTENVRVEETIAALRDRNLTRVGAILDASHASARDDFAVSTAAVEATVARLHAAGAIGARLVGGGFGGSVLGLMPPDAAVPAGALVVSPGAGARLINEQSITGRRP